MKITETLSLLSTSLVIAACAGSIVTDPGEPVDHHVPTHTNTYDVKRGGVQIVAIYYNQTMNRDSFGLAAPEEWVVIKSDKKVVTKGWWINAGDKGQDFFLPDTLNGRLYVFTHNDDGNVPANVTTGGVRGSFKIQSGTWIWNNSDHDIATLHDANNNVVDTLSY